MGNEPNRVGGGTARDQKPAHSANGALDRRLVLGSLIGAGAASGAAAALVEHGASAGAGIIDADRANSPATGKVLLHDYLSASERQKLGADPAGFDFSPILQRAVDQAPAGAAISIPAGRYRMTSDVTIPVTRHISLIGDGQETLLEFLGSGLIISGAKAFNRFVFEKIAVLRHAGPGPAIHIKGTGAEGVSRWALRDVLVSSSEGTGLRIEGAWTGVLDNLVVTRCSTGVEIVPDRPPSGTSMNALTVIGGETQGCGDGWIVERCYTVKLVGHVIEGNTRGFTSRNMDRCISIDGCHFEVNREYDVSIGGGPASGGNTSINNCLFKAVKGGAYSVLLRRGRNLFVERNAFFDYTRAGVRVSDDDKALITGMVRNNYCVRTPKEVEIAETAISFGAKCAVRYFSSVEAAGGKLTSFGKFMARIPEDVSGKTVLRLTFQMPSGGGKTVVTDCIVRDAAGRNIPGSPAISIVDAPTAMAIGTSERPIDLRQHAGETLIFEFRRRGDTSRDNAPGAMTCLTAEVENLTSEADS